MSLNKDSGLYEVSKRIVKIQKDIIPERINDIGISTIEQNVVLSKSPKWRRENRENPIIVPWDDRKGFNPASRRLSFLVLRDH